MNSYFIDQNLTFNEHCLKSGWAKRQFSIQGDHILSFEGAAKAGELDCPHMLHIIIEHFGMSKSLIVAQSHIFQYILVQFLGNDFFFIDGRIYYLDTSFSISKVRQTHQSAKCHIGLPITPLFEGGVGLSHFDIGIKELCTNIHQQYVKEFEIQSQKCHS